MTIAFASVAHMRVSRRRGPCAHRQYGLVLTDLSQGAHQFRTRNSPTGTQQTRSEAIKNEARSTKLIDIPPLITVWLQVRVLPGPPAFAGYASFGSASHIVAKVAAPKPIGRRHASGPRATAGPASPTKISKTTPCKVTGRRRQGGFDIDTSGKSGARFYDRAPEAPGLVPATRFISVIGTTFRQLRTCERNVQIGDVHIGGANEPTMKYR